MKPKDYNTIISGALFSDGKKWIRRHALSAWLVALAVSISLGGNSAMADGGAGDGSAGGVDNPIGAGGAGGSSDGGAGGGAGITGGGGGDSTNFPGTAGGAGGAVPGAAGAVGGSSVGSGAGGGGGGAHGFTGVALPGVVATGGAGGAGGVSTGWSAGGGGAGGWGAVVDTTGNLGSLGVAVTGGAGGAGGNSVGWSAGSGGSGGTGLAFNGGSLTVAIDSAVTGGAGGVSGNSVGWYGGSGGSGGAGLAILGGSLVVTINSAVTGGAGSGAGSGAMGGGANGAGGAGLIGSGVTITMGTTGTISGGSGANAITFTGGSNVLTFNGGTSGLTGNIGNNGTLLTFNQPTAVTVSNNITGTGGLAKDGLGTLTLSGSNTYSGGTTISQGTLNITALTGAGSGTITLGDTNTGSNAVTLTGNSGTGVTPMQNDIVVSNQGTGTAILELTAQNAQWGGASIQLNRATTLQTNYAGGGGAYFGEHGNTSVISGNVGTLTVRALDTGMAYVAGNNTFVGTVALTQGNVMTFHQGAFGGSGNSVIMSGTAGLRLYNAGLAIGSLTGDSGNTINTSASGSNILTISSADPATFAGEISGTGGILKAGTGTQTLSGTNIYTGTTTISAGTLQFAKQVSLYNNTTASWTAANINVKSGATLAVNVDSAGANGFDSTNLNTLLTNISVANTAAEGLQAGAIIGFDTSTATGGTFTQGNAIADSTGSGAFHGAIGLTKLGTGTLVLDKANTYTGATTISEGTLQIGDGGTTGSLSTLSAIINNGTLTFNQTDTVTQGIDFSGAAITGTGALIQNGSGNLILNAANTYEGGTTVRNGDLTLSGGGAINHSAANLTIGLNSGESATLNVNTGSISAQELYVGYTGNGVLNLSNGTITNTKGFIGVNSPSVSSANITGGQWDNTDVLTVGYGGTGSLAISGTGTVNSAGAYFGFLAASDGNTATIAGAGASWTSDNTFYLGHDGSNNTVTVSGGALLANGNADFLIGSNAGSDDNKLTVTGTDSRFTSNGTFYVGRSGTGNQFEVLAGGSATSRNVRIGGGTGSIGTTINNEATVDGAGSLWNVTGTMRIGSSGDNSALTISNGGSVTTTGNSFLGYDPGSDNNQVTITGANSTWTANNLTIGRLGANNTVTVENAGTLSATNILLGDQLGSSGALQIGTGSAATVLAAQISEGSGDGTVTFNSGTLRLTGNQADLFSAFGTGDVTLGSGGGTIDTQAFSVATGYALSGAGGLTKDGAGTLTLSGDNAYTGATTISAGILQVDSNNALGTIAAGTSVTSGAALVLNGVTYSTAEALEINGTGVLNGGALVNSGTSSYAGTVTAATDATINTGAGGILTFTGGLVKNGTVLTLTGGGIININTVGISGSNGIIADSDLIVDGVTVNANVANTYNGPTYIRSTAIAGTGLLNANVADALPTLNGRSAVIMDDSGLGGSRLNLGADQSIASLDGEAFSLVDLDSYTLTIGYGTGLNTNGTVDADFAGVIDGSGSLIKDDDSTQILSGANAYTGTTTISAGILELTGSLASPTIGISLGATLNNVNGGFDAFAAVTNAGTLRLGAADTVLSLSNTGLIDITAPVFSGSDLGFVAGIIDLNAGSSMLLSNSILEIGEIADIFDGTITGSFSGISDGSDLRFSMNYLTGEIQALPGVLPPTQYSNAIYNLNRNQTWTAGALFEDTYTSVPVDTNFRKVYFDSYGPLANVVAGPTEFFVWDMDPGTGLDADPALAQLVSAMTAIQSTYSVALDGSILVGAAGKAIIDQLSPEVHRGMVDYTEQALRSHVRDGVDAAPISKIGKTQVFATLQTSDQGVDTSDNNANYDLDMVSLTTGVRYDIDKRFQIGGLLGMDDGSIEGALVDTDAQGIVGGIFGRYVVDEASNTRVTASASYGSFDYDSNRHSFGGDADADSIGSDAFELALGVSTVAFKKDGFRVIPNATLRYMDGSVDGFEEDGPGIALRVEEQDLNSVLLDLGVDFEYQAQKNLLLIGRIGYVTDFEDSDNSVGARFAASGPDASPFTVSAPGIEDEAFVLGLGTYYDFNENTRVGLTYRGEFRTHSEYTQSIGIGASFGF